MTVLALAIGLVLGLAGTATATPPRGLCGGCHPGPDVAVSVGASQTANNGTTATYGVTVSNTYGGNEGWAVFDGSTNVANGLGTSGTFSVATGKTYQVYGVSNTSGSGGGYNSVAVSPIAPPPPPPPPAQQATVNVSVKNAAGAAVAGAKVQLSNRAAGFKVSGTTNAAGVVSFANVPFGSCGLLATARGYSRFKSTVTVAADPTAVSVTLAAR